MSSLLHSLATTEAKRPKQRCELTLVKLRPYTRATGSWAAASDNYQGSVHVATIRGHPHQHCPVRTGLLFPQVTAVDRLVALPQPLTPSPNRTHGGSFSAPCSCSSCASPARFLRLRPACISNSTPLTFAVLLWPFSAIDPHGWFARCSH
jgi:hypothetical protein